MWRLYISVNTNDATKFCDVGGSSYGTRFALQTLFVPIVAAYKRALSAVIHVAAGCLSYSF